MPAIPNFWLYFVQRSAWGKDGHRWMFGETWLSTDPETSFGSAVANLAGPQAFLGLPFGASGPSYTNAGPTVERLWPLPRVTTRTAWTRTVSTTNDLNPAAPEAAFRLQRVGAAGVSSIGRVTCPIRSDAWFTDLPHRRQVNVAALTPLLALGMNAYAHSYTSTGRTYRNVIFHRRDFTWDQVTHYQILPNPVRIWQRSRQYDPHNHPSSDVTFVPPIPFV